MTDLSISDIFVVSLSNTPKGANAYNTSNLALFTRDTPGGGFGSLGYQIYKGTQGPTTDFGTGSKTANMANAVFSQQPNILGPGGSLIVIPFLVGVDGQQTITYSAAPASGSYVLNWHQYATGLIQWNAVAADIQLALRALPGLGSVTVSGSSGGPFTVHFANVGGNPAALTVTSDTLLTSGAAPVTVTIAQTVTGTHETLDAAITRTSGLVQYFGLMAAEITNDTVTLAAAAVIQPLNKIGFFVSRTVGDLAPSAIIDQLRTGSFNQSRGLFYGAAIDNDALVMMASYASRGLSVDFTGSNTTITMELKDLIGVQPDPVINETYYAQAQASGADIYASVQGIPKVLTSGANTFFDRVYNQQWFAGALLIAAFNVLAQTSTKIPQTESGMDILKGSARQVCAAAVINQYAAPGSWTRPDTFGNLNDFLRNVSEVGFYIFSQPITQQLSTDRAARKAPLIQIALKEAGAVHKGNILVYINA